MQHGINCRREESQISEPGDATICEKVPNPFRKLKDAGFRLFTLTNNTAEISRRQLERAGLLGAFERQFSVDEVRRHKPAPEVYAAVARAMETR